MERLSGFPSTPHAMGKDKHQYPQPHGNFKLYTATADAPIAQIPRIFTLQGPILAGLGLKTCPTEGLVYSIFEFTISSSHVNDRPFFSAAVHGDHRLRRGGDRHRFRHVKTGARKVQNMIAGFFGSLKGPKGVVGMGDGLCDDIRPAFYAATVRGYHRNG